MKTKKRKDWKTLATNIASSLIRISVAVLIVALVYKFTEYAYDFGYRIFAEEPMTEGSGITVTVSYMEDDSIRDLGQKLYDQGLIRDVNLFYFQEQFSNYHDMLQPGVYELNTSMTVEEMLAVISEGMAETIIPIDEMYEEDDSSDSTEDYSDGGSESSEDDSEE